jgi:hypothetical protein
MFRMCLGTISYWVLPVQYKVTGVYNREGECLLRGKNRAFKADYSTSLTVYTNTETGYYPEQYIE